MYKDTYKGPERRRDARSPVMPDFVYMYVFPTEEQLPESGVILDYSRDGVCIAYCSYLEDGYNMKVHTEALGDFHREVVVKWCHKIAEDLYKVGLNCC